MNYLKRIVFAAVVLTVIPAAPAHTGEKAALAPPDRFFSKLFLTAEFGFLSVLDHRIQFSEDGTWFDYRESGGQDVLFPVGRFTIDLKQGNRHGFILLYQPLRLETRERLDKAIRIDKLDIPRGTPVRFLYNFPFFRISYLYDFLPQDNTELSLGISLQIRNATIEFENLATNQLRTNRDTGPVPIIKTRLNHYFANRFWIGGEADGFYAPISYLNGSDEEVTGAILDASIRGGYCIGDTKSLFLNIRYLGGGAVGTSSENIGPGDGYVKNWLHFLTVSTGFRLYLK